MNSDQKIIIQFVERDGCYKRAGVRVRCAPGNGDGSLYDEMERGIKTPLGGEGGLTKLLECISSAETVAFIRTLPIAKFEA